MENGRESHSRAIEFAADDADWHGEAEHGHQHQHADEGLAKVRRRLDVT